MAKTTSSSSYDAAAIQILQNVDHVRARPSMYIGGVNKDGLHHIVWEILDNAVDEVINGYASKIEVKLSADRKGITITDDGRGPVDKHPELGDPGGRRRLTQLGAGGKLDGQSYRHSGGLHGVGAGRQRTGRAIRFGSSAAVPRTRSSFVRGVRGQDSPAAGRDRPSTLRPDPEIARR
jgi:hypothetical protein